ncbi:Com family DNA-binding transcriptional regulator, partial [Acinetobacter baumannii]|uniref:Com family DNA-binding transcriptional regulator n=1 Tax=Acinetobacter baumannii TaxID=470 RepID=UPI0024B8058D
LKCYCRFQLLARTDGFNQIEIKCPCCKTLNTFQSILRALLECLERQTPGKIHYTKSPTSIQS